MAKQDAFAADPDHYVDDRPSSDDNDSSEGSSDGVVASTSSGGSDVQLGIATFLSSVGALQALGGIIVTFSAFSEPAGLNVIRLSIGLSSILTSAFWFGLARIVSGLVRIRRALKG